MDFYLVLTTYARVTNYSKTCLDHTFIKNIVPNKVILNILRYNITDHYPIILIIFNINIKERIIHNNLILHKIDINHWVILIKSENWYSNLNFDNVDKIVEVFNSKIQEFINYSTSSKNKINK